MKHEKLPVGYPSRPQDGWACYCTCKFGSEGHAKPRSAEKAVEAHVRAKNEHEAVKARLVGHTPQKVVQAAWALFGGHPDVGSISWETGTTVIVVFQGEGGSVCVRHTLSADLSEALISEKVRAIR